MIPKWRDDGECTQMLLLLSSSASLSTEFGKGSAYDTRTSEIESQCTLLKNDALTLTSAAYDKKLKALEENFTELRNQLNNQPRSAPPAAPRNVESNAEDDEHPDPEDHKDLDMEDQENDDERKKDHTQNLELLICFDSNWQYINRRKLWKEKDSDLKRCGTLFDVSRVVKNSSVKGLKYFLLHVGTNDLDNKHYLQVLDELKQLLNDVRCRFPGVKFIVSELLPRNDVRDEDVQCFNTLLRSHAERDEVTDITVATHQNMRDPTFTMFYDEKHLKENSVPRFAKNLIRAMLSAYNIQNKSELYPEKPA